MIHAHAVSHPGPVRSVNEDSYALEPGLGLFIVADGMGGHNAGEVASRLTVEAMVSFVGRSAHDHDLSWPYGLLPDLSFDANRLRTAIHLANRRVFRAAESHDDYTGMGTTVVAVLVSGSRVALGHVGDSRIYRVSGGVAEQMTADDSWAAALLAQGATAEELARHPMRHVLTNVVGARDKVEVHLLEAELRDGDGFLLCSDGLYDEVAPEEAAGIMADGSDARTQAERLVSLAIERGARDNVTALVLRYEAD